jgi:hypothetical protein
MSTMSNVPPTSDEDLVQAWLRHAQDRKREDFWAWDRMNAIVLSDAKHGWRLICDLIQRANDDILGDIGVGPIEDLVHEHHTAVIDEIVKEARNNPRFRAALTWMWFTRGSMPSHVERQLLEATNNEMRVL